MTRTAWVAAGLAFLLSLFGAASAQAAPKRCTITGTSGPDVLRGTPGPDVICGRGGDDAIVARAGDDVVRGGAGNDRIMGQAGDDHLIGGPGRDVLLGGSGENTVDRRANDVKGFDYQVKFVVTVHGAKGASFTVREGSESYCTRDESHGTYSPDSEPWSLDLVLTVKNSEGCFLQRPINSWMFSVRGEDLGEIKFHENWAYQEWECMPGIWPRARCEGDRHGIDVWL